MRIVNGNYKNLKLMQNSNYTTPLKRSKSLITYHESRDSCLARYSLLLIMVLIAIIIKLSGFFIFNSPEKSNQLIFLNSTIDSSSENLQLPLPSFYLSSFCSNTSQCKPEDLEIIDVMVKMLAIEATKNNLKESKQRQASSEIGKSILTGSNKQVNLKYGSQMWANLGELLGRESLISIQLEVIKHSKLTSPKETEHGILSFLYNAVTFADQYDQIEKIFDWNTGSMFVWRSPGSYLTVHSTSSIKPAYFEVMVSDGLVLDETTMMVFGLNIQESYLISEKTFSHTLLGKYRLSESHHLLRCELPTCSTPYSLILFAIRPMRLHRIRIHEIIATQF